MAEAPVERERERPLRLDDRSDNRGGGWSSSRPPTGPAVDSGWGSRGGRGGGRHGRSTREPPPAAPSNSSRSGPVELDAFGRPRRDYRSPSPDMEEIRRKRKELAAREEAERARVRDEEEREQREREREKEKERKRIEREEWVRRQEEAELERERQLRLAEVAAEQRRRDAEAAEAERARQAAERAARGPTPPPVFVPPPPAVSYAPIKISFGQRRSSPSVGGQQVPPPAQREPPSRSDPRDRRQRSPPSSTSTKGRSTPVQTLSSEAVSEAIRPASTVPPEPQRPRETYEKLAQVGEGTYGKVYKARNIETGAFVALKRIRMEGERDGFPVTAMREIKLLQSLRHPNVVALHEMMVSQGASMTTQSCPYG